MRDLILQLISQYNLSGTPQEIADFLNTKSITVPNEELYTSTGLIMELGPDMAREILGRIEAAAEQDPLLRSQIAKINSTGIQLSHPITQAVLTQLVQLGVLEQTHHDAINTIAFKQKSPWEVAAGDGAVVSVEDVEAALNTNPQVSYQVLASINCSLSDVAVSVVINTLYDGRPAGRPQVITYRSGGTLPSKETEKQLVLALETAVRSFWETLS